jgi:hypothetical protein
MKRIFVCLPFLLLLLLMSCNRGRNITRTDTFTSGVASVVCDESLAPILNEQIAVFQGLNPDAEINPVYTNEVEAYNLLLSDSIRVLITAREPSVEELDFIRGKKLTPRVQKLAIDGVALIVNPANTDTLISLYDVKKILTGDIAKWSELNNKQSSLGDIKVVFDNPNSSTVRMMKDSLLSGRPFSENLSSLRNNPEVLEYVSKTPNALGIIGVNWISNPRDTTSLSFVEGVNVMSISLSAEATATNSYKPYPAYLALNYYPLKRDIYAVLTDLRGGLPAGFVHFLGGEKGQRIILKAGLVPATQPTRLVRLKDNFE